jgi:hypothetical protein
MPLVDSTTDAKTAARVKVAAQALRAAVEVGARRVPAEVLKELQQAFDPQLHRHKCFIAARVANDLPGALFVLSGEASQARRQHDQTLLKTWRVSCV